MTELGDLVRQAREDRGWSLRQASDHTGIHNAHLSQIETGKIERPSMALLWDLSIAYDLSYQLLLRLAGHADEHTSQGAKSLQGALLHATGDLTDDDLQQAIQLMQELRRRRQEET